jgi:Resolvase, N terminal domain
VPADRTRPAAYIRAAPGDADLARHHDAVAEGARQRGWPPPAVYTEHETDLAEGHAPAMARLEAAIESGRHDALLITEPGAVYGTAPHLLRLLHRCTRHGVVVGFLLPPPPATAPAMPAPHAPDYAVPFPLARQAWGVLARARIEALSQLFPGWRIWLDQHGWHARRRDTTYLQTRCEGAPAFSVHADTPTELAAQLCWQQAADHHAPDGCTAAQPPATRH